MRTIKQKKKKIFIIENQHDEEEIRKAIDSLSSMLSKIKKENEPENTKIKNISVDWNDFSSVDKAYLSLQGRRQQLKKELDILTRPSATQIYRIKWDSIKRILDTDISVLYDCPSYIHERKYYVYAHCDTTYPIKIENKDALQVFAASLGMKYIPFYIGKGTGDRFLKSDRNRYHTKIVNKKFNDVDKLIIKKDLSESEALQLEAKLIDIFGLKIFGGHLINIDEGLNSNERKHLYKEELMNLRKIEETII